MLTEDGRLDYLFPILPAATPLATINVKPPPADLVVQVGLQGGGRPDRAGWNVDLEVKLFNPGANLLEDTPLLACVVPASKKGDVAQSETCHITSLSLPGLYGISVTSNHRLINLKRNVPLAQGHNPVKVGAPGQAPDALLEGNANNDERINILDFGTMVGNRQSVSPIEIQD